VDDDGEACLSFEGAIGAAEIVNKRLPSAAEYDALVECTRKRQPIHPVSGTPATIDGLFNGIAEWTTTRYDFSGAGSRKPLERLRNMIVLKGYGEIAVLAGMIQTPDGKLLGPSDAPTPNIGWRGVRSGAPRFVQP
jgi:hypothetical protein